MGTRMVRCSLSRQGQGKGNDGGLGRSRRRERFGIQGYEKRGSPHQRKDCNHPPRKKKNGERRRENGGDKALWFENADVIRDPSRMEG